MIVFLFTPRRLPYDVVVIYIPQVAVTCGDLHGTAGRCWITGHRLYKQAIKHA